MTSPGPGRPGCAPCGCRRRWRRCSRSLRTSSAATSASPTFDPAQGTIEIYGQRYMLVRAASMSVEFFDRITRLYADKGTEEAAAVARSLLFDIAHALGAADARNFHARMSLRGPDRAAVGRADPLRVLRLGVRRHLRRSSRPSPDEDFFLLYDHPYSFESHSWLRAGKEVDFGVCIMNAGYSSGWCEESFGVTLVAAEILCQAKGDEHCRFVMAHPSRIEGRIEAYLKREPEVARRGDGLRDPRLLRPQAGGGGAARREGSRRARRARQGGVPGQHEPRDPHADERGARHDEPARRHRPRRTRSRTSSTPSGAAASTCSG